MKKAKIVNIKVERGDAGLYYATSPQLKELFVSGETEGELYAAVPTLIEALFAAKGMVVSVIEAEPDPVAPQPWVVLSCEDRLAS